ncbi:sulfatase [Rhodopirellula sp. SWK7]|uniref:sulfatase n=1 Tax=Rhodopirellula sp. SWK7 TaxID=595460 RepID=UPI0002BDC169|nr:sulfatase [Rhodopirellula sp. SWK7]EMI43672.1 N-acetylgalactosamine 6-sulfate sulfatase (GALNS) [Rhodopirellula sp. SWK7]
MNRLTTALFASLIFASAAAFTLSSAEADERPNILIFYVDDLGWQDVQLNDLDDPCPYETPNVVKLAKQGMNFTQAYSAAPTCAPSRAGIMTGQHPGKLRYTHVTFANIPKGRPTEEFVEPYLGAHLPMDALTLATALKDNGYATGHVGKWHLGLSSSLFGFEFSHEERGVHRKLADRTKGFATANDPKYPLSEAKYPPVSDKKPDGISYPYDDVTESALRFMQQSDDKPFFLYLAHWMVHWPVMTRNGELLEHYCDKLGQPFPPEPGDVTLKGQQNPYFASMVTTVDWSLGRIVDYLNETDDPRSPGKKLIQTTYVMFTSDNGGAEKHANEIISDNYPLKYGKAHDEEGGIRVPMVITGPGIPQETQFDGLVNQLDFFPTILNLTQSQIDSAAKKELSGLDITPVLLDGAQQIVDADGTQRENLFWHFPHGIDAMKAAIREGDFKLYKNYETRDYSLYRLYQDGERYDLEEMNDLAAEPEYAPVVKRLSENLEQHLVENQVEGPYLNPAFKGKTKPSADIQKLAFKEESRRASVRLRNDSPVIKTAYVIYRQPPGGDGKKARRGEESFDVRLGMKTPATIAASGHLVSAQIPDDIDAYCFLLIDENDYQTFSDIQIAR